jgi:MraZ protein
MGKSGAKWGKEGTQMLMGEFQHTVDEKGRLFMPAKLREGLGSTFYISKGLDGCLFVYDKEQWELFESKLNALPLSKKEARDLRRYFFAGATEGSCDKHGRVLLPLNLRQHAGITKDVVIVGVGNRAEIWAADRWTNYSQESAEVLAEKLTDLGI